MRTLVAALLLASLVPARIEAAGSSPRPPGEVAADRYNEGLKQSDKGDQAAADGNADAAKKAWRQAADKLSQAVAKDPALHPAWSQLGYVRRRLGDLAGSLAAYDKALELSPGYGPATEYRAQTWLAMGKLEDAKAAYLELYESDKELAGKLEGAMARFVVERNKDPAGLEPAAVTEFTTWLARRRRIARQDGGGYSRPIAKDY